MKVIKNILMSCLLLAQGMNFGAEAPEVEVPANLPGEVTLVCYNKNRRKDMQQMLVDGVMKMVPSGRFYREENGRIEHVSLADLNTTFDVFEEALEESRMLLRDFECDVSVLQRVLFDYGIGGVTDPDPTGPAVYGDEYDRVVALLRPKTEKKSNEQKPVAVVEVDPREALFDSLPDNVTLKCTDGTIPDVGVFILMDNFEYFDAYFRNWGTGRFAYTGEEVVVDGTAQDMDFLLMYVFDHDCSLSVGGSFSEWDSSLERIGRNSGLKPASYLSLLKLANQLCLKKEAMDSLLTRYSGDIQQELYSKPAYEKFLREGEMDHDLVPLLFNDARLCPLDFFEITEPVTKFDEAPPGRLLLVQPDRKVILGYDDVLERYNSDGTRDTSFSSVGGGLQELYYNNGFLQPDGKIVVVGSSQNNFVVARYNSEGTLDASFGSGGMVTTHFNGQDCASYAYTGLILTNGKIVVAGSAHEQGNGEQNDCFALAQYNSNGTLDNGFGIDGMVKTYFAGQDYSFISKILLQRDGKIIAVGPVGGNSVVLVRYNPNGTLDASFGSAGRVTVLGRLLLAPTAFLRQDGHILVTVGVEGSNDLALVCYDHNGLLDAAFGRNGRIIGAGIDGNFAFSDDGSMIVGTSSDKQLYVYDTESGRKLIQYSLTTATALTGEHLWILGTLFCQGGKSLMVSYGLGMWDFYSAAFLSIHLPVEKIRFLQGCFNEEQYLYWALKSRVQEAGHKLDTFALPEELETMFDRLPRALQDEILTPEGYIKRELVRDVEGVYARVKTMFGVGKPAVASSTDYTAVD